MPKQAKDKTASELFYESGIHLKLAFWCLLFAIVKAVRSAYTGICTPITSRVQRAYNCTAGFYRNHQPEVFMAWSVCGWSFAMSFAGFHLYLA